MKTYKVTFKGRHKGAIGRDYLFEVTVEARDTEHARELLYEDYDHILGATFEELKEDDQKPLNWIGE